MKHSALCVVLMCVIFAIVYAEVDEQCLECICMADSGCNNAKCKREPKRFGGNRVCGFYKLSQRYYHECGAPGLTKKENKRRAWQRCAQDKLCSSRCVLAFATKYADESCIRKSRTRFAADPAISNCEAYAKSHFGGPNGCRKGSTNRYWNQVQKCLEAKTSTGSFRSNGTI